MRSSTLRSDLPEFNKNLKEAAKEIMSPDAHEQENANFKKAPLHHVINSTQSSNKRRRNKQHRSV